MSKDWEISEAATTPPLIRTGLGTDIGLLGQYAENTGTGRAILEEIVATRNACKGLGHPEAIAPLVKQLKHCLEHGFKEHDTVTLQALVSHLENGG